MKKIILGIVSVGALSLGLAGCGNRDDAGTAAGSAAGGAVGAGVGFAATAGNPVGAAVGAGVGATVGSIVGKNATEQDMVVYRKNGVVYHDGHAYRISNGKYVLVR